MYLYHRFVKYSLLVRFYFSTVKTMSLNFGPQHPAAHGVLRLILNLHGEIIVSCDANIGLLHRGTEKLTESRVFLNSLPYFDRLDYVSTILQEHAYCLSIETLSQKIIKNISILKCRTIFDELTRILNHYLAVACHALDVGSMSTIFWAFEDRERIMGFYEAFTGARMHVALYKPFSPAKLINRFLALNILTYLNLCRTTLNEIHNVLSLNKIWKIRLKNNGVCNINMISRCGITGVIARSVGVRRDLRIDKYTTYNNYFFLNFKSYISESGDSYARFLLRLAEINESLNIVNQSICVDLHSNFINIHRIVFTKSSLMELTINKFKYWSSGFTLNPIITYRPVESAKGEFGVILVLDGGNTPYRCKIKSPSFFNLFLLNYLCRYISLADLITLIGTVDIVFGEVDR